MSVIVIVHFLIVLSLTITIEWLVVLLFGYRYWRVFLLVAAINFVTNPLLNFLVGLIPYIGLLEVNLPILVILEVAVIFAEWGLLNLAMKGQLKKTLLLSAAMNLSSFILGLTLF